MKIRRQILGISSCFLTGLYAMENTSNMGTENAYYQKQEAIHHTYKEEDTHKIWLLNQIGINEPTKIILEDVKKKIVQIFMDIPHTNPIFNGKFIYTDNDKEISIKTIHLYQNNGDFSLPQSLFGDIFKYLLITTDPEQFFHINKNNYRIIILITTKLLIEEKITSSAAPFKKIVNKWDEKTPIGIFYRAEYWEDINCYDYLINTDLFELSKNSFHANWGKAEINREKCILVNKHYYAFEVLLYTEKIRFTLA